MRGDLLQQMNKSSSTKLLSRLVQPLGQCEVSVTELNIHVKRQGCLSKYASRAQKVSHSVTDTRAPESTESESGNLAVRPWPVLDAIIESGIEGFTFVNERMLTKTTEGGKANLPTSPYLNTNAGEDTIVCT